MSELTGLTIAAARDGLKRKSFSASELTEALIVNPYDLDQAADALARALTMPAAEQRDRIRAMRAFLAEFNVYRWAGRMLLDAARMRSGRRFTTLRAPAPVVDLRRA